MNSVTNTDLVSLVKQHPSLFITGTDTEVGKTYCTSLLIKKLMTSNIDVFPFKPISAGTEFNNDLQQQVNEDALALHVAVDRTYSLSQINPIVFKPAIAPHIAAELEQKALDFALLNQVLSDIKDVGECRLIEGAGGWLLPLNDHQLMSDWVAQHQIPVIMVVAIKLGCLNHALLTAQAIEQSGCDLIGWIANFNEGESEIAIKNAAFIEHKLNAPLLFKVKKNQSTL